MTDFLTSVFPEIPEGMYLHIWMHPSKESEWWTTVPGVFPGKQNHYIGVGLSDQDYGPKKRCSASRVAAMPGLVADLDIKDGAFPDLSAIQRFVGELPMTPTITVASGGGVQAWWLFRELWVFETDEEREECAALSRGWGGFLSRRARAEGVTLDSVWDLARLMRVPGTFNHKYSPPRPVSVLSDDGPRYNPEDFREWVIATPPQATVEVDGTGLVWRDDADVESARLQAMLDNFPQFRASWEHKRKDFSSCSEYDMSLATLAAQAGWEQQAILNLLIRHRIKYGEKLHLSNKAKYLGTIGKALAAAQSQRNETIIGDTLDAIRTDPTEVPEISADTRSDFLATIAKRTGCKVERLVVYSSHEESQYEVVIGGATIHVGGVSDLMSQRKWQEIALRNGVVQQLMKSKPWMDTIVGFQAVMEVVEVTEANATEALAEHIRALCASNNVYHGDKLAGKDVAGEIHRGGAMVIGGEDLYFTREALTRRLGTERERWGRLWLSRVLRELGFANKQISARENKDSVRKRRYLKGPAAILEE
jgi:putative DNA primase/helicase